MTKWTEWRSRLHSFFLSWESQVRLSPVLPFLLPSAGDSHPYRSSILSSYQRACQKSLEGRTYVYCTRAHLLVRHRLPGVESNTRTLDLLGLPWTRRWEYHLKVGFQKSKRRYQRAKCWIKVHFWTLEDLWYTPRLRSLRMFRGRTDVGSVFCQGLGSQRSSWHTREYLL